MDTSTSTVKVVFNCGCGFKTPPALQHAPIDALNETLKHVQSTGHKMTINGTVKP